ncbi:cold-shock protein [Labrys neptuniae]|uniref:Cold-shock protein n=1 Tax=Labrys neptuniae TaxID=376174 RepID=A0ABV3PTM4_9HYPH
MITGSLKWFNYDKGYGFIAPDDGSIDAFVHIRELERNGISTVREGQRMGYELVVDAKTGKSKAGNLKILPSEGAAGS